MEWSPDIEGKYTLYASFLGSAGYYPSHAVTAFAAAPEPQATAEPTPEPQSTADMYFVPAVAGLAILGIITLALLVLMMMKKP
jgi:hypothetical protein